MPTATAGKLTTETPDAENSAGAGFSRGNVALVLFVGALWFLLCRHLSNEWSVNEQYSYGWFVPFFVAYLFWLRWDDRPEGRAGLDRQAAQGSGAKAGTPEHQDRPSGVVSANVQRPTSNFQRRTLNALTLVALFALLPLRLFEIGNPDWRPLGWAHAAIVVAITLIILGRIGGARWVRHFAFPTCFIFVAVPWLTPIEGPLVQGLMRVVAAIATETLALCGIPAQLEGSVIRISSGLVGVNEACSGVRSLQTSLMIGLLFGELKRLSVARRFALVGAALAIAFIANCGRAFFLVWMAASRGVEAVAAWHDIAGYAILGLVFVGTMLTAAALASGEGANPEEDGERRTPNLQCPTFNFWQSGLRTSVVAAGLGWLIAVELGAEAWYRAHERGFLETARWTVAWPEQRPGFEELEINEDVRATLRFDAGREVTWPSNIGSAAPDQSGGGIRARALMFFFRWEPGTASILRARAHRPDVCLPNTGWIVSQDHGVHLIQTGNGMALPFRHFEFRRPAAENRRATAHTFFCQREDRVPPSAAARSDVVAEGLVEWGRADRIRAVREGLRNQGQQVLEVALTSAGEIDGEVARAWFTQLAPEIVVAMP